MFVTYSLAKIIVLGIFNWRLFSNVKSCIFFSYLDGSFYAKITLLFGRRTFALCSVFLS